ncbi:5-deoxy-glucuronate isomerase [soil metagenome]
MNADLHLPAGTMADGEHLVRLTPDRAGWAHTGLRVLRLEPGARHDLPLDGFEAAVLPLSGGVDVEVGGARFTLRGRDSVFAAVTDWAYLPSGAQALLSSVGGCEVALPTAVAGPGPDPAYVPAADVPVEIRGAGQATRQVTNFASPDAFDGAQALMCVELLTPDGNWSSYPPHKHDDSPECPVNNEEIYYFRIGRTGGTACAAEGFGMHRTYDAGAGLDQNVAVRDGDVFLIPRGYHGPCVAAPGYPMYYLNVLAGPGGERSMAFCDDPAHHWVRETWEGMPPDPRCPMTSAEGVVGGDTP